MEGMYCKMEGKGEKVKRWIEKEEIGIALYGIQIMAAIAFVSGLVALNILPTNYLVLIVCVVMVGMILIPLWLFKWRKKTTLAKIVSLGIIIVLIISSVYITKANSALSQISSVDVKMENMVVVVSVSDSAETIIDALDYTFAVQGVSEEGSIEEYTNATIEDIEEQVEEEIEVAIYDSLIEEINALENSEVEAIIYNEAYISIVEEEDPDFSETVKVIYEYGIEIELETVDEVVEAADTNAFTIYISGIDVYGSITKTSRSDVNIIAVVNPDTEQILLVSTPRDYYVTFPDVTGESKDKLTHAAIYGVDVSINTLEAIYDMEIDYYARVNFTSLTAMVDALGGVEVYSSQSFYTTAHNGVSIYVSEGMNEFSGSEALLFARERYNLDGGDFQRGENQEELVKAMIEKITSPSIITGAYEIIDSVADNVDTNMSTTKIQELIKTQIDEGTDWEIIMVSAEGTTGSAICYSYSGSELSVVYPDEDSVAEISEMIQAVISGKIIDND